MNLSSSSAVHGNVGASDVRASDAILLVSNFNAAISQLTCTSIDKNDL